ncbi:ubiquitin-protein ligase peroxin 12, partial [Cryomyces antarcticus]
VRETLRLRRGDVWKNLAVLVALPYLRRKLDESYDIYAAHATVLGPAFGSRDGLPPDATVKQRLMYCYKWFLRNVYPSVNAAYYFSLLAFNLAYLFDGSKFSSPFLWLIGTRMRIRLSSVRGQPPAAPERPSCGEQGPAAAVASRHSRPCQRSHDPVQKGCCHGGIESTRVPCR